MLLFVYAILVLKLSINLDNCRLNLNARGEQKYKFMVWKEVCKLKQTSIINMFRSNTHRHKMCLRTLSSLD